MDADIDKEHDVILFPFPFNSMGDLQREEGMYSHRGYKAWDMDDGEEESATHEWGAHGRIIVYAHGSSHVKYRHMIYGDSDGKCKTTPAKVAAFIKALKFPTGAGNEIVVWSCGAGVVGGFAQLLTLHLINEGYIGKRVWGCNDFGGIIDADGGYLKVSTDGGRPRRANAGDVSFYIGAGKPLGAAT